MKPPKRTEVKSAFGEGNRSVTSLRIRRRSSEVPAASTAGPARRRRRHPAQGQLPFARVVHRLHRQPGRFLRRVEAGRVLGLDEIEKELRSLMIPARVLELRSGAPAPAADLMSAIRAISAFMARLHIWKWRSWIVSTRAFSSDSSPAVAALAGAVDVGQRAVDVVVADLEAALALVRHVAVRAGHARPRVHALVVQLELRMLGLEHLRPAPRVGPVGVVGLGLVVLEDLIALEAVVPRIRQTLFRILEVVLDVTLPADVRAHLLAGGGDVRVRVPLRADEGVAAEADGDAYEHADHDDGDAQTHGRAF
jgi:hypothetical protein